MGKASRRKQERSQVKAVVMPGQDTYGLNMLTGQGMEFEAKRQAMPPKVAGQHRLIVTVMYRTSPEAMRAAEAGEKTLLDMENIIDLLAGCWDCEEPWQHVKDHPVCPGDPSGRIHG
jgi:hypothetical protein